MNQFLKNRPQIDSSTQWLRENSYTTHPISCKDWELRLITEALRDGDLLDMGADGSFVLHNAIKKNIAGFKVGIDLAVVEGDNKAEGATYVQGDLMDTPFDDASFDTIVSQSVLEHNVDIQAFAKEAGRLLRTGGKLFVSFDYWPEPIDTSHVRLYGLPWRVQTTADVQALIGACGEAGLHLTGNIDWSVGEAVINPFYCSPAQGVSYTFAILEFVKI